ncbi:MAG: hypothetical protein ACLFN8_04520 [Candidatus Woesearchaeota archaeon]
MIEEKVLVQKVLNNQGSGIQKNVKELKGFDTFLLKYSKVVDSVDMCLGPVSELTKYSDADLIKYIGVASFVVETAVKFPFVCLYLGRTKDFSALYDWVPKELFSNFVPMGSFVDILRSYEKVTYLNYGLEPFSKVSL